MAKKIKAKNNASKMGLKGKVGTIFIAVVLTLLIVYTLSQFLLLGWGFMTSLKHPDDFDTPINNVIGLPNPEWSSSSLKFGNYVEVLKKFVLEPSGSYYSMGRRITYESYVDIWGMIFNSLMYVIIGGVLRAIVPCVVAYMCSKYKYKFSKFIAGMVVVLLSVHIIGAGPASIKLQRDLGLYNNWLGQVAMHSNFLGMYFLVFLAYFDGLSDTYSEAAEIDGASQFRVLVNIGLPLAMKMMTTIFLLNAVALWNDYNTPMLYLPGKPTLAYAVYRVTTIESSPIMSHVPMKVTGGMILAIPMTILFIVFKKQLMGNVTMGGLKE